MLDKERRNENTGKAKEMGINYLQSSNPQNQPGLLPLSVRILSKIICQKIA